MAAQRSLRHDEHEHEHKELGLHNERGFPVTAWSRAPWRINRLIRNGGTRGLGVQAGRGRGLGLGLGLGLGHRVRALKKKSWNPPHSIPGIFLQTGRVELSVCLTVWIGWSNLSAASNVVDLCSTTVSRGDIHSTMHSCRGAVALLCILLHTVQGILCFPSLALLQRT